MLARRQRTNTDLVSPGGPLLIEDYHVGKGSVGGGVNVCFVFLWLLVLTVDGDVEVRAALMQREGSDGGQGGEAWLKLKRANKVK